ncbi:MAG: LysR family transcriptional regulator, partial [Gammaproteobacteria bacterium]|nr:LysR family transcriptional regulator [Gammaproteobacteria bacterium]
KYPDVTVHLKVSNTDGIVHMVENNDIDLGVVEAPVSNKNLVVEVCRYDELVAIVSPQHELAGLDVLPLEELIKNPFICREEGSGTREVIAEHMQLSDIDSSDIKVCMELGSPESVKGAVEAGMGMSVTSRATIMKELKLGTLVSLKLDPPLTRPFSFVHQKQKFRHLAMDELLSFARQYCKDHHGDVEK